MSKGKMIPLTNVQGKTRPFYVRVQEHLYEDNILEAPAVARQLGLLTISLICISGAFLFLSAGLLSGVL